MVNRLYRLWCRVLCRFAGHDESWTRPGTCMYCGTEMDHARTRHG